MTNIPFFTTNDKEAVPYHCHNADVCTASWTYDDHHCTGCHWKGLGTEDIKAGNADVKARYLKVLNSLKDK